MHKQKVLRAPLPPRSSTRDGPISVTAASSKAFSGCCGRHREDLPQGYRIRGTMSSSFYHPSGVSICKSHAFR
jgi:hypothetical protein